MSIFLEAKLRSKDLKIIESQVFWGFQEYEYLQFQEIEDIHTFGGQTPVKRLEDFNVCRENEFFSQVLNDQIRSN